MCRKIYEKIIKINILLHRKKNNLNSFNVCELVTNGSFTRIAFNVINDDDDDDFFKE